MKVQFSEEELAEHNRIAREYGRQSAIRHNTYEHDLTNKIWLQQEAIRALPAELTAHALELDETPPPADRPWPYYYTPPIENFSAMNIMEGGGIQAALDSTVTSVKE
jgi:hypothetical protein